MREKFSNVTSTISRGNTAEALQIFDELFHKACPKFVSPVAPDYESTTDTHIESTKHQLNIFLQDVESQLLVPNVRSYLKLYTTLEVGKLSQLLDIGTDQPDMSAEEKLEECRRQLMVFKHKTRQRRWESGELLEGEWGMSSDLDFFLVKDMTHIAETKVARRVGEWFARNISKFEDIAANFGMKTTKT